jgi:hypothetical protein
MIDSAKVGGADSLMEKEEVPDRLHSLAVLRLEEVWALWRVTPSNMGLSKCLRRIPKTPDPLIPGRPQGHQAYKLTSAKRPHSLSKLATCTHVVTESY